MSYYHHRKTKRREHRALNILYILAGIGLIVVGASLSLVPGVPGIVLGVPGLAMLAARSKTFARLLDFAEVLARRIYKRGRAWFSQETGK